MSNVNTKNNVRTIAVTGMLSAVAVVLMYLEIPIPIMPGFIKFDFSDLPALLGAYALGPVAGIIICLIKNVVHPVYYKLAMPEVVILSLYQAIIPSMKSIMQCLICFNLPFTIVKGLIDVGISMLIYKPLSPLLKGKH